MTYGIVSHRTSEVLARYGLTDALDLSALPDDGVSVEIDIVYAGALDESFEVRPDMADDVAACIFEAEKPTAALDGEWLEVSVYERGGEYAECLHEWNYDPDSEED